jgi:O-antigen ligase
VIFSGSRSAWLGTAAIFPLAAALAPGAIWRRVAPFAVAGCSVLIALQFQNFQDYLGGAGSREVRANTPATAPRSGGNPAPGTQPTPTASLPRAKIGSGRLAGDESANFRYLISRAELELGRRHPLAGVGLGNLGPALGELPPRYVSPKQGLVPGVPIEKHNTYAGLFAELGAPGALTFVALLLSSGYILFRSRRAFARASDEVALIDGLLGALVATVIVAGFTDADRHAFLWWIVGLALGISALVGREQPRRAVTEP